SGKDAQVFLAKVGLQFHVACAAGAVRTAGNGGTGNALIGMEGDGTAPVAVQRSRLHHGAILKGNLHAAQPINLTPQRQRFYLAPLSSQLESLSASEVTTGRHLVYAAEVLRPDGSGSRQHHFAGGSRFAARSHFALRNRFGRRCGRRAYAADKAADR